MARTPANFKDRLWDLARMEELEPDSAIEGGGLNAVQSANVLLDFNRGYQAAYRFTEWEDAWTSGALTPNGSGIITYAQIQDAHRFGFWDRDPRPAGAGAFKTSDAGIHPQVSGEVFGFWMPKCPVFTLTAYNAAANFTVGMTRLASDGNCYECIQAHNAAGGAKNPLTETAYWRMLPVLAVLAEAVLELGMANMYNRTGKHGSATAARKIGEGLLDEQAALEFPRVQSWAWIRRAMN
jgi:hypothetical protein